MEVDEENFLVIENRATPKWWWLVHPALPEPWRGLWKAWADSPPGWGGSQEKWKSPDGQSGLSLVSLSIGQRAVVARFGLPAADSSLAFGALSMHQAGLEAALFQPAHDLVIGEMDTKQLSFLSSIGSHWAGSNTAWAAARTTCFGAWRTPRG